MKPISKEEIDAMVKSLREFAESFESESRPKERTLPWQAANMILRLSGHN